MALIHNDSSTMRSFNILPNADSDPASDTRQMIIHVRMLGTLPFVSMSQQDGLGDNKVENSDITTLTYNRSVLSAYHEAPTVIHNFPYDPDIEDRFTFIAYVGDMARFNDMFIYFDKKYSDLIMIPSLESLGADTDENIFPVKTELAVSGYKLGLDSTNDRGARELSELVCNRESATVTLDNVNAVSGTASHTMAVYSTTSGHWDTFTRVAGDTRLASGTTGIQNFASLGRSEDLFDIKVPVYRAITIQPNAIRYIYVGRKHFNDVLIPIPV